MALAVMFQRFGHDRVPLLKGEFYIAVDMSLAAHHLLLFYNDFGVIGISNVSGTCIFPASNRDKNLAAGRRWWTWRRLTGAARVGPL